MSQFGIRQPIPAFPVLLRRDDSEPIVDMNSLLHAIFDRASYDLVIDYSQATMSFLEKDGPVCADTLHQQHDLGS